MPIALAIGTALLPLLKKALPFIGIAGASALSADVLRSIITHLIMVPLYFSAFALWLSGTLLDFVLGYVVVGISDSIGGMTGINIAWGVIRDLINMSFIFILLYAAIKTILGDSGLIKRTIIGVVIAAVLVNFSLFFAKAIIDASNVLTITIHESIVTTCAEQGQKTTLSSCFMNSLGLTTLFSPTKDTTGTLFDAVNKDFSMAFIVSIFGSIFLLTTTFVFLAASVMFAIRFVVIVLLFIFSPLAVIGSSIPGLAGQSKKWWSEMTDQAIFAPVFMLLNWVVLAVVTGSGFSVLGQNNNDQAAIANVMLGLAQGDGSGISDDMKLVANFLIIIIFMVGILIISRGFSKHGGSMGGTFAGKMMGGLGGYAARRTIGARARKIADDKDLKERAAAGDIRARLKLRSAQSLAKSSFDMRGALPGGLGKTLGAGKASGKGGYDQYIKDKAKKEKEFSDSLGPTDIEKDQAKRDRESAMKEFREARARGDFNTSRAAWDRVVAADKILGINKDDVEEREDDLEKEKKTLGAKQYESEERTFKNAEEEESRLVKELEEKQKELDKAVLDETEDILKEQISDLESELEKTREIKELAEKSLNEKRDRVNTSYEQQKSAIKKQDDLGTVHKKDYANAITEDRWINRSLLGLGPIKRSNLQAAADIRKGKKSVKEQLEEIYKESGEGGGEDKGKKDGGKEEKEGDEEGGGEDRGKK